MRILTLLALATGLYFGTASAVYAKCGIDSGRVSIIANEFDAILSVTNRAKECADANVKVTANTTADHQKLHAAGLGANPAEYTAVVLANSSLANLLSAGLLQPMNDLVAEHGQDIKPERLIKVGDDIMAVAFMTNAQHLVYRDDILKKVGVAVPKSYEDVLAAAKKIRDAGILEYPLSGAYQAGWHVGQEFVNMYFGYGGELYKAGTAQVSINNAKGIATLNMLKALTEYMNPDYLTHDANGAAAEWEAGNVALMNFWGSRAVKLLDTEGSTKEVYSNTKLAGPLMVGDSGQPASTLWWDGWSVARNISDEDAEASFLALKHAISPGLLNEETMPQAVWLIDGFVSTEQNAGVIATAEAKARPYPSFPFQGLLHTALGDNLPDFLQGKESAKQTLADIEAAYTAAAKEKGFL